MGYNSVQNLGAMWCVDSRFPIQEKAGFREDERSHPYQINCSRVRQTATFEEKTTTKVKPIGRDRFRWPFTIGYARNGV